MYFERAHNIRVLFSFFSCKRDTIFKSPSLYIIFASLIDVFSIFSIKVYWPMLCWVSWGDIHLNFVRSIGTKKWVKLFRRFSLFPLYYYSMEFSGNSLKLVKRRCRVKRQPRRYGTVWLVYNWTPIHRVLFPHGR